MSEKPIYLLSLRRHVVDKNLDEVIHAYHADTANQAIELAQRWIISDEMSDIINESSLNNAQYFVVSILCLGKGLGFAIFDIESVSKDGQMIAIDMKEKGFV